jgi:hypothetical protein
MSDHLRIESSLFADKPHGWIQWKGTNVCIDLHCSCGAHCHFDGDFLYYWKCPHCSTVWEMGTHVSMYPVPVEQQKDLYSVENVEKDDDL